MFFLSLVTIGSMEIGRFRVEEGFFYGMRNLLYFNCEERVRREEVL